MPMMLDGVPLLKENGAPALDESCCCCPTLVWSIVGDTDESPLENGNPHIVITGNLTPVVSFTIVAGSIWPNGTMNSAGYFFGTFVGIGQSDFTVEVETEDGCTEQRELRSYRSTCARGIFFI